MALDARCQRQSTATPSEPSPESSPSSLRASRVRGEAAVAAIWSESSGLWVRGLLRVMRFGLYRQAAGYAAKSN